MNAIGVIAAASTGMGAAATIIAAWLRARSLRQQAREKSRRDYLHSLPGGSRVIDLGDHGVVIEVGPRGAGAGNEADEPR
jgi:preprotein translocase subunit YajC